MTSTSDSERVERALRAAFHDVTRDVRPKPRTGQVIERRLRRRRRLTVAASLVAAAVVAATLTVLRTSPDADPAVLAPATANRPAIRPRPVPAATGTPSEVAIRAVITHVLTSTTADEVVPDLEDGPDLRSAVQDVIRSNPGTIGTIKVLGFGPITFPSDRRATVEVTIRVNVRYGVAFAPQTSTEEAAAVLTSGGWKFARDAYCDLIGLLGTTCPAR